MLLTHAKAPPARATQLAYRDSATAVACCVLSRPFALNASCGAALVARGALCWRPLSHRRTCLGVQGRYGCSCRVGASCCASLKAPWWRRSGVAWSGFASVLGVALGVIAVAWRWAGELGVCA